MNTKDTKKINKKDPTSLKDLTFDLINWPEHKKAQLIYNVSGGLGIYAGTLLFITITIFHDSLSEDLNQFAWVQASLTSYVYSLICFLLAYLNQRFSSKTTPKWYVIGSLIIFTAGNILGLIYMGTFAPIAGVAMSGAPMIGMLLYNKNVVIMPLIIGLTLSMVWFIVTYLGFFEYAYILHNSQNRHNNTAWLILNLGATIPQIICIFYIAWVYVDLWKIREKQALHLSRIDPLTQAVNRRYFISLLKQEIATSIEKQYPISLLMIDLDHFKKVNDTYNHQVGDFVLIDAVTCLKSHLPKDCILSRYGGEEFCVMMPNTCLDQAYEHANRLRQALEVHVFVYTHKDTSITLHITTSIGVSHWSPDLPEVSWTKMLSNADQALYQAKNNGRNQVVCAKANCQEDTSLRAL